MTTVTQLEQELEQARVAEKAAQKLAVEQAAIRDRELHETERNAATEVRGLTVMAETVFAVKAPASRPSPETRGLSRKFLHEGLDFFELERLALDRVFGDRLGISRRAGQMMTRFQDIGVTDEALWSAVDAIEIRAWGLAVERARELAGEST